MHMHHNTTKRRIPKRVSSVPKIGLRPRYRKSEDFNSFQPDSELAQEFQDYQLFSNYYCKPLPENPKFRNSSVGEYSVAPDSRSLGRHYQQEELDSASPANTLVETLEIINDIKREKSIKELNRSKSTKSTKSTKSHKSRKSLTLVDLSEPKVFTKDSLLDQLFPKKGLKPILKKGKKAKSVNDDDDVALAKVTFKRHSRTTR